MFANLKNKLIEEVKASPSKFQQLANAAQAAVSSTTNTSPSGSDIANSSKSPEQCFSITEEDTPENSPSIRSRVNDNGAFVNNANGMRARRMSNSSMASDMSFRLPQYDMHVSQANNFQSDLESEADDSVSNLKLDVISKEQIMDAYKKSVDRYNKYRSRYMNLAKKFKDLEQDSSRARAVLVETQEKAMRRINELREQCSLEHRAKIQCEKSLRLEIEEIKLKMQQQQQQQQEKQQPDGMSFPIESDRDSRLKNLEEQLAARDKALQVLKSQEEENSLLLAQTKLAIHSELEAKEKEVLTLTDVVKNLQNELKSRETQAEELVWERERRHEVEAKLISTQHMMEKQQKEHATKEKELLEKEQKNASQLAESYVKIHNLEQQLNDSMKLENDERLEQLEGQLQKIMSENSSLADASNTKDEKIRQLEIKLEGLEMVKPQEHVELEEQFNQIQSENLMAQEEIRQLKAKLNESEEEFKEKLMEAQKESQLSQEELEKLNTLLIEKEKEFKENLMESQRYNQLVQEELEKLKTMLNESAEEFKDKLMEAKKESQLSHEAAEEFREKLVEAQKQNQLSHEEVQQLKTMLSEKEEEFNNKLMQAQQTSELSKEEVEELKKELLKKEEIIIDLQTRTSSNDSEYIQKLLKDKESAQNEAQNLRKQVECILQAIEDIEHQLEEVNKSHSMLESEKQKLEKHIESMSKDADLLAQAQEDLKQARESGERDGILLSESQEKLKQTTEQLEQMKTELTEYQNKIDELTLKLDESEQKCAENAASSEDNIRKYLEAEKNIKSLEEKYFVLEQTINAKTEEHHRIEEERNTLQNLVKSLETEQSNMDEQLKVVKQQLLEKKANFDEEANKRLKLEAKLEEMHIKLEEREMFAKTLEHENKEKAKQLDVLSKNSLDVQETLIQLEIQKKLNAAFESEKVDKDLQVKKLQKSLTDKEKELETELELRKTVELKLQENQNEFKSLEQSMQSNAIDYESRIKSIEEIRSNWEIKYADLEKEKQLLEQKLAENEMLEASILNWENKCASLENELKEAKELLKNNSEKMLETSEGESSHWQTICESLEQENNALREELRKAELEDGENGDLPNEQKLKMIMQEVQDVSSRNVFLEQQCENYLILEQANERLKLQNAKLSRQLDETLVSIQHSDYVPANTEFEYLKNIMFQYLTGSTNNDTLVKVISAVLKFSPQQTQVALEKEHQRRSLINKIL